MTLTLPDDVQRFIEQQVKSGKYASANEVVCAGVELLKGRTTTETANDFAPGEWDRLLGEAEKTEAMDFDDVVAKRRAERARFKAGQ